MGQANARKHGAINAAFSAHRAVREYTEQRYLPAAAAYRERSANKGAFGRQLVDWQHSLEQKWDALHFGEVKVETRGRQHVFEVHVWLNDLDPHAIRVELYADGINGNDPERMEMKCAGTFPDNSGGCVFRATIHTARPASDYTARIIPGTQGPQFRSNPLESCGNDDANPGTRLARLHLGEFRARLRSAGSPLPFWVVEMHDDDL